MFEIPFISKNTVFPKQEDGGKQQTARMAALVNVADRLVEAGWSVDWGVVGLSFAPPTSTDATGTIEQQVAEARQQLTDLGIQEDFRQCHSPSMAAILIATVGLEDRLKYGKAEQIIREILEYDSCDCGCDSYLPCECMDDDGLSDAWDTLNELRDAMTDMSLIETSRPGQQLRTHNDHLLGVVRGRLEALEWLFGRDWPDLEVDDAESQAEEAEQDVRQRACDRLGQLLTDQPQANRCESSAEKRTVVENLARLKAIRQELRAATTAGEGTEEAEASAV